MSNLHLGLGLGLGPEGAAAPAGVSSWATDGGLGRPANQAEWDYLIAQAGLTGRGFSLTYNCQEASGNLAEADGGITFTANGGAGGISYQQAVAGFTLKAFNTTDGGAAGFEIASGAGPNPGTQSVAMLVRFVNTNCSVERALFCTTQAATHLHLLDMTGAGLLRYYTNNASANSVNNYEDSTAHTALIVLDRTNSTTTLYTEEEKIAGVYNSGVTDGIKLLGGRTGALSAATQYMYCAIGVGTEAEWTSGQAKTLFQTLGYAPSWS